MRLRDGRDPRQARYLTAESLRWVLRHKAFTPWYLVRYWRLMVLRLRHPHVVTQGMVFLGRRVELRARPGYGRLVLGRWVHLGDGNVLRAHEGTLTVGDKCVLGRDNTVNCYLDVEIGAATLVADWVYVCDFDHVTDDVHVPIKDQGIVKSPVRIGPGTWIGVKASVLRGTTFGRGLRASRRTPSLAGTTRTGRSWRASRGGSCATGRRSTTPAAAQREALADMARKHRRGRRRDATAAPYRGRSHRR